MNTKLLVALTCLVAMALSACKSDPVAVEEQHSAGDLSSTTIKIEARNPDPINKDGGDGQASLVAHATTSSSSEPSRPSGPSPEYNLTGSYATDGNGSGTVTPLSSGAGKTGDGEQWNPLNAASADVPTSLTWTPYTVTYQLGGSSHSYTFDQYQQAVMQQLQQARQDAEAGYTPTLSSSDTSMPDSYSIADFEQQGYEVRDLGNDRIEVRRA